MADKVREHIEDAIHKQRGETTPPQVLDPRELVSQESSNAARRADKENLEASYKQYTDYGKNRGLSYSQGGAVKSGSYTVPSMCKGGKVIKSWSK